MAKGEVMFTSCYLAGFEESIPHGVVIQTHEGRLFRVHHKWWRRVLHFATRGRVQLHPAYQVKVIELHDAYVDSELKKILNGIEKTLQGGHHEKEDKAGP